MSSLACTTAAQCLAISLATVRRCASRRARTRRQARCSDVAARARFEAESSREQRKASETRVQSPAKIWLFPDAPEDTRCAIRCQFSRREGLCACTYQIVSCTPAFQDAGPGSPAACHRHPTRQCFRGYIPHIRPRCSRISCRLQSSC